MNNSSNHDFLQINSYSASGFDAATRRFTFADDGSLTFGAKVVGSPRLSPNAGTLEVTTGNINGYAPIKASTITADTLLASNGNISLVADKSTKLKLGRFSAGFTNAYITTSAASVGMIFQLNESTDALKIRSDGLVEVIEIDTFNGGTDMTTSAFSMGSGAALKLSSTAFYYGTVDAGVSRGGGAGIVAIGTGAAGSVAGIIAAKAHRGTAVHFASLSTTNGDLEYCDDCTIANPCAGSGTGAYAKRLNGVSVCN
jgi:hypothetical protein